MHRRQCEKRACETYSQSSSRLKFTLDNSMPHMRALQDHQWSFCRKLIQYKSFYRPDYGDASEKWKSQLLMRPKMRFLGKLFLAPKRSLVWSTSSMQIQRWKFNYKYGQVCFRHVVIYLILRVKHVEIDYELVQQPLQQRIACQNKKRNRNINIGIVYLKVW